MDLNKAIVRRAVQLLEVIQERRQLISLNMVVCLNNKDLNQPGQWLISSLQASSLVNKVAMVLHQLNLPLNTRTHRWAMEVLPALVVMAAVLSKLQTLSGARPQPKALGMDLVGTRDNQHIRRRSSEAFFRMFQLLFRAFWRISGYQPRRTFLLSFCICVSSCLVSARPFSMKLHRALHFKILVPISSFCVL